MIIHPVCELLVQSEKTKLTKKRELILVTHDRLFSSFFALSGSFKVFTKLRNVSRIDRRRS